MDNRHPSYDCSSGRMSGCSNSQAVRALRLTPSLLAAPETFPSISKAVLID
jgi:hypothetical protein